MAPESRPCEPASLRCCLLRLELNGGLRAEQDALAGPGTATVTWVSADADVTLARAWYVMISATRQRGGVDGYDQVYGGLSFRF